MTISRVETIQQVKEDLISCISKSATFKKYHMEFQSDIGKPESEFFMFGSLVSGLANRCSSDMDLTFVSFNFKIDHKLTLINISKVLQKYAEQDRYKLSPPFLQKAGWTLELVDNLHDVKIDIMINKVSEIYHS